MESFTRGLLGLGVTLFVVAAAMAAVNGIARGYAARRLAKDPNDANGAALLMLY